MHLQALLRETVEDGHEQESMPPDTVWLARTLSFLYLLPAAKTSAEIWPGIEVVGLSKAAGATHRQGTPLNARLPVSLARRTTLRPVHKRSAI